MTYLKQGDDLDVEEDETLEDHKEEDAVADAQP